MMENETESVTKKKYQDLALDLNLDKKTADEAWTSYETIKISYSLEGDQLPWLLCALYTACRKRSIPTVGGRPGNMIQGNCVSLTRMLQYCSLPLTEFIMKMKAWLAMTHCDEAFCRRIELLERNFAVSSNIFKEYEPIFLDLFQDPKKDQPRPPRSRKQRRPPCNASELFNFCWTLYIFIKGKYPSIPQDLVSCFSLLLACIDLMYTNVIMSDRKDLLNPLCKGLPTGLLENDDTTDLSYPTSIMDYLCKSFEGVVVDTKVVRDYYCKTNIKDLVEKGILKGSVDGTSLINQVNFDHNVKEIKNAYEEYLLSCGEFDERMFLNDQLMVKANSRLLSTSLKMQNAPRCNLYQAFEEDRGDHHLIPQTPITGRQYTVNRPVVGNSPLTVITTGLHKLYALISGRKSCAGPLLLELFETLKTNPEEKISKLVTEMSGSFVKLYSEATEDYTAPSMEFTKMRLQTGQILYFSFLEHILYDEKKRKVDLEAILKEDLFHRTLFTCCFEIVLKSYNDARRFPWSLQVGKIDPYYFFRIIEPVIRSEKQSENQLSRELVKHLKGVEEQILDSLSWSSHSPLWQILKDTKEAGQGVPSCEDVNFSHQLESTGMELNHSLSSSSLMSPAVKVNRDITQSPLSSIQDRTNSPRGTARRMLFPTPTSTGTELSQVQQIHLPGIVGIFTLVTTSTGSQPLAVMNGMPEQPNTKEAKVENINTEGMQKEESKKDKPRRHGSLALFFRKFYTLANMRLRDLCDRLDIRSSELRHMIWTCFEHSIIHYTDMMADRHMDQMIMCAVYITCKVTGADKIFQEIMKHYRSQPQAASHVYRSVLISRNTNNNNQMEFDGNSLQIVEKNQAETPLSPSQVRGTSVTLPSGERGDLIKFYNMIYVKNMKNFALKFRRAPGEVPRLSPLPIARTTPVSPRKKISSHHSVFINTLSSNSPLKGAPSVSPRPPLPYFFNRSPAKDLRVINNMVKIQSSTRAKRNLTDAEEPESKARSLDSFGGVKKRMQDVLEQRHSSSTGRMVVTSAVDQGPNDIHILSSAGNNY